jgi:phage tail sheath protein FI
MATVYKRPGTYIEEVVLPQQIAAQGLDVAVAAFVGATERGNSSDPVFVSSWSEYVRQFGSFTNSSGTSLAVPHAVYQFFSNSGRGCYVSRLTYANASTATVTLADEAANNVLIVNAASKGQWAVSAPTGGGLSVVTENTKQSISTGASGACVIASLVATVTTTAAHGLVAGQKINVSGLAAAVTAANGAFTVATTPTTTTFTYAVAAGTANVASTASTVGVVTVSPETFNLSVYYNGTSSGYLVERYADINLDPTSSRYALTAVNGVSEWITLSVTGLTNATFKAPASSTTDSNGNPIPTGLTGSSLDGTVANDAALAALFVAAANEFDAIPQNLIFNVPDAAYLATDADSRGIVQAFIAKADARGDSFVVVDTPNSADAGSSVTFVSTLANKSANSAAFFPWIKVPDPTSNTTGTLRTMPPGASVIGLMLSNDAINGVYRSAAGVGATLANVVATSVNLSSANLDAMNSALYPVNAIRPVPGAGFCVMGARTLNNSRANRYIAARRTLLQIKKAASDLTQFALFEANNPYLWGRTKTVLTIYLNDLWQKGGLKGATAAEAFFVKCDETNNTSGTVADGQLNVSIGVALQTPAEFITIRIGQFQGNTTVQVEE